MKVYQSKLTVGTEGKVLIDSTNVKLNSATKNSKKKKSGNVENYEPVKHKNKRKDEIYVDPPSEKKSKYTDASTQTDSSSKSDSHSKDEVQKVIDMMTSETPPSEYWETLAEKRRCALKEALEENKYLKDENEYLKGENKIMEEMLEEAKQLAVLIQSVTGDKDPEDKDSVTEALKATTETENGNENQTRETEDEEKSAEETENEYEVKPINETEETRT